MAAQYWPGESPLGKRIRLGCADSPGPWITVVGVVGRIKQDALDTDSRIALYLPHTQYPARGDERRASKRGTTRLASPPRSAKRSASWIPICRSTACGRCRSASRSRSPRRRFSMLLLTLFASLALGLAAIGVYGVMAYLVSQGTRELGIRMALGATPRRILVMVVRQGLAVAAIGVGIGLVGAFGLTRLMQPAAVRHGGDRSLTFAAIALLLAAIALVASFVPALRAARIDPMVSLRSE